jgi:hypothetical protein
MKLTNNNMKNVKFFLVSLVLILFSACSEDDGPAPTAPTGSVTAASGAAGGMVTLTGSFADAQGLSSIILTSTVLSLNSTITLNGETSYDMSEGVTIPGTVAAGNVDVTVTVTNSSDLSTDFVLAVTVSDAPCPTASFDDATSNAESDFTDANADYNFEDYSNSFTGISIEVDDNCETITITGDFLDWATIDDTFTPELNLTFTPGSDSAMGSLSFTEEIMGPMSDGFSYRMSTSGSEGTYNATDGTLTFSVYIDYDIGGEWVYWYTNTTTLTVQ